MSYWEDGNSASVVLKGCYLENSIREDHSGDPVVESRWLRGGPVLRVVSQWEDVRVMALWFKLSYIVAQARLLLQSPKCGVYRSESLHPAPDYSSVGSQG